MTRRTFTPAQHRAMARYAEKYGTRKAAARYSVVNSVVYNAQQRLKGVVPKARANGNGLEAILCLKKATALIEKDLRNGAPLRDSDAYVRLALSALTQKET